MNFLLVFIGGGVGSCLRYSFSLFIKTKPNTFPWATLSANLVSCFIIGLLIGFISKSELSDNQRLLLITGFCGGFSTFSTFGAEVLDLVKVGMLGTALSYVFISIVVGCLLVLAGTLTVGT
jgi:CrcB protein